ncbi:hypothetical protein MPTK1_3g19550 [Marchantia polymorpha subsp. ruderalis]|uniref:Cell division cycle protein 123 n=2 Tax=Marchantia polymorpha TaxID=3197 RepID=A0AAF6B2L0_MARPO|nr:hypothetical protein MARPO_0049s0079 [Marchantia polymorpha]BBN06244.1 hypothetical protein Mp_3g19550 [Marchantia polymorpha subsp. ruderalis]|eukprot:PTQ38799.1 hypothetical protein MARPO_0049s0079 [Marchantia polymorpha]
MKEIDVLRCQIQEWYPRFRRVSLRTKIHVLPQAFVDYLLEDGLFLPSSSEAMPTRTIATCPELQSEDYVHWDEEDEDDEEPEVPSFCDLEKEIKASIEELGGAVFPKLNWTAPKDTTWIATSGNLQCRNFAEISLLLKASDSVTHDLLHAFDSCEDQTKSSPEVVVLALRKWYDLRPELEFRAFVFGGLLVGICQREVTGFYASLTEKVEDYEEFIFDFFFDEIRDHFPSKDYTFDCYVTRDGKVKLVDFNTWGGSTLPLLFTWEELQENFEKLRAAGLVSPQQTTPINCEIFDDRIRIRLADMGLESSGGDESQIEARVAGEVHEQPVVCDVEYRVEFRIVTHEGLVQPGMRIGTGIPIDFINKGNWEEVIRKEAADEALRERTAAGA